MDLIEDDDSETAGGNAHEYTVAEISGAVKRTLEGAFGHVRVRGEIGRVSRPSSGHVYFDLKDDRAVIAAVSWKGQAAKLSVAPEEGMEVIAIGRLTTFPGQSKYQLIVDDLVPAGAGALMVMLEKRRAALAAEGLFDAARKRPLPYLPEIIGVVTSPTGAVIRDILHRLRDRFPRHVLIWPVAVQGEKCAAEVAAAIVGFNALTPGGAIPRPDLLIVARGGGSIEDLWGFNDEAVVRAAAASEIPLISAVGHETDTTLIDHAADMRAPTPTAAAEMAVPVRLDLLGWTADQGARLARAALQRGAARRQQLRDLARALGHPAALLDAARQRADLWAGRLGPALRGANAQKRAQFARSGALMRPAILTRFIALERRQVSDHARRLTAALQRISRDARREAEVLRGLFQRLAQRFEAAPRTHLAALATRLDALDRTRLTLGYGETLRRGFAVVRGAAGLVTSRAAAARESALELEFHDGRIAVKGGSAEAPERPRKTKAVPPGQGRLF